MQNDVSEFGVVRDIDVVRFEDASNLSPRLASGRVLCRIFGVVRTAGPEMELHETAIEGAAEASKFRVRRVGINTKRISVGLTVHIRRDGNGNDRFRSVDVVDDLLEVVGEVVSVVEMRRGDACGHEIHFLICHRQVRDIDGFWRLEKNDCCVDAVGDDDENHDDGSNEAVAGRLRTSFGFWDTSEFEEVEESDFVQTAKTSGLHFFPLGVLFDFLLCST